MRPERAAYAVLCVCWVLSFASRGLTETFSVFLLPLSHDFHWERGEVVSIQSVSMLTMGLFAPFAGRIFDRLGPGIAYTLGLGLLGAGFSLAAFADSLWQFHLCFSLGVGIGASCIGNAPNSALVSRWFRGRLTVVMAVVWSAGGIGVLAVVPLTQLLIAEQGWRGAYHWIGLAVGLVILPFAFLPWRRFRAGNPAFAQPAGGHAGLPDDAGWTLARAVRHPGFWGIFMTFVMTGIGMFMVSVQVVAYLTEIGFEPLQAATAWGFSGLLMPIGMIGFGWLDGRIGRRPSVFLSYALSLSGVALLWYLGRDPSPVLLGVFVLLFGGTFGARGPLLSTIAMGLFRGRSAATIFGAISIGTGLGPAIGAWLGGVLHDISGGYDLVFAAAFLALACGTLPLLTIPSLRR